MGSIEPNEIKPGLVAHLQPDELIKIGGSFVKCPPGTEVKEKHFFLIVQVDAERSECIAFPLYSQQQGIRDRIALDDAEKSGKPEHWIGRPSFYFKWQFWRIPLASVSAASFDEDSEPTTRRHYASANLDKLATITGDMVRSRDKWRPPI